MIERRPLDDDFPHRYLESDIDYVLNNVHLCVDLLDAIARSTS